MAMAGSGFLDQGNSDRCLPLPSPFPVTELKVALAGGGPVCLNFLKTVTAVGRTSAISILALADPDPTAPALALARELGLPNYNTWEALLATPDLEAVVDFTADPDVADLLNATKPTRCAYLNAKVALLMAGFLSLRERDPAEARAADQELDQKFRKFQTILDSVPYRIMVVNLDYSIDIANRTYLDQHGLTAEKVRGHPCYAVRYGYDRPCDQLGRHCYLDETVGRQITSSTIIEYIDRGGKKRFDVITVAPIMDDKGRVVQHLEASRDVTDRISLEQEVRQSNTFLQKVIQSAVDGIVVVDTKGRVLLFNEGMARMTGHSVAEIMNDGHLSSFYDMDTARENMKKMRSAEFGPPGKLNPTSMTVTTKDGRPVPVTLSAAIIEIEGREIGSVGVFTDMREIEAMRRELDETHLKLVQSDKIASLGRLAAGVAHEINNPLSVIMMYAEMIEQGLSQGPQAQNDIREIITQTLRCKNIVADLLEFSRRSGGQGEPFRLDTFLKRCLNLLKNLAIFHDIAVEISLAPDMPRIKGDMGQLEQVFTNLFTNAADAMSGKGRLTIRANYDPNRDLFVVRVADTGPGIPADLRDKVFEIFFTTKPVGAGTGLGLSISRNIIENHGGTIRFDCPPEGGTIFTIELPRAINEQPDDEPIFIGMDEI